MVYEWNRAKFLQNEGARREKVLVEVISFGGLG